MFQGKRIVITGASAGIGAELAVSLTAQGARVVVAARTTKALDEVVARCTSGAAHAVACDVADPAQCKALVDAAVQKLGGIDVFVNNAGISMRARFDEVKDLAVFEQLMRVNYLGAVYCTHFALDELKRSKGLIVAVSSVTGKLGIPTRTGYVASKHAMQGFFDALRVELLDTGVDVCVISPGPVATDIRSKVLVATQPVNAEAEAKMMSVHECVAIISGAIASRRREVVMGGSAKLALWLKLIAPGVVDRRVAGITKRIS